MGILEQYQISNIRRDKNEQSKKQESYHCLPLVPDQQYTPEEIANDAYECWKAGAVIVHIHVLEAEGTPFNPYKLYKGKVESIPALKNYDVCMNITCLGKD